VASQWPYECPLFVQLSSSYVSQIVSDQIETSRLLSTVKGYEDLGCGMRGGVLK
jgi:hypothetical protein